MRLELEQLELRNAPTGLVLTGGIVQQAAELQQYVQQQLNAVLQPLADQFKANQTQANALLVLAELKMVWGNIEPAVFGFASNTFPGADLSGFAGSLEQVSAALGLFSH